MAVDMKQILTASILLIVAVLGGWYVTDQIRSKDPLQDRQLLTRGMERPCIWVFVDNSHVNSRWWKDFGARSDRALNVPFLNLCYETIVKAAGIDYRVEVIGGLADLAVRLGGWEALPTPLRNSEAVVNAPELNWIRAAVLAKWGGLWVTPSTICLKKFGKMPLDKVVLFGTDEEQTYAGSAGSAVPGLRVAWSPVHDHPVWVEWESKARARLEKRSGGSEFRRDEKSDTAAALIQYGNMIEVRPTAELGRKGAAGRRIQLEDLLASGTEGDLPFDVPPGTVYVPVPWPEILERRAFGWFLRMSEEQVLESDLAVSWLLRRALA